MSKAKPKNQSNGKPRRIKGAMPKEEAPEDVSPGFGSRRLELLRLERKLFPKAGKEKRVERAVKTVRAFCGSFASKVDLETVKWIAQDADILDI
jgi:hypothetical protein